ncbi:hypothetical protein [Hungatella hathewayi]|uniref:hypothetical protein n=1 Tax=Hungatella hathewayi TaxID=154046 RepID=UPI00356A04BC
MKKLVVVVVVLSIISLYTLRAEEQAVISTFRNNRELVSAYIDGKDVTDYYSSALEKALRLSTQEMEAASDCMMGTEYITIELIYDGNKYTFCCGSSGKILSVNAEKNYSLNEWEKRVYSSESTE